MHGIFSIDDIKKLQAQGYDGVHYSNTKGRSIYLAFNNDQLSPALSVPMERKFTETNSMKIDRQAKKILERHKMSQEKQLMTLKLETEKILERSKLDNLKMTEKLKAERLRYGSVSNKENNAL